MRGIAYAGVIRQLETHGIVEEIARVGGTSAGAITALLVSLGYDSAEILAIVSETRFQKFNDGRYIFLGGISRLNRRYGWYRGEKFLDWVAGIIAAKTGDPDITFIELRLAGFKDLHITGSSINHQRLLVFSADTYPQMRVSDARAQEVRHVNPATIGVRIDSDAQIGQDSLDRKLAPLPVENLSDYMQAFYVMVFESLNRAPLVPADWQRTISVSARGVSPRIRRMSPRQLRSLTESGEESTLRWLRGATAGTGPP